MDAAAKGPTSRAELGAPDPNEAFVWVPKAAGRKSVRQSPVTTMYEDGRFCFQRVEECQGNLREIKGKIDALEGAKSFYKPEQSSYQELEGKLKGYRYGYRVIKGATKRLTRVCRHVKNYSDLEKVQGKFFDSRNEMWETLQETVDEKERRALIEGSLVDFVKIESKLCENLSEALELGFRYRLGTSPARICFVVSDRYTNLILLCKKKKEGGLMRKMLLWLLRQVVSFKSKKKCTGVV